MYVWRYTHIFGDSFREVSVLEKGKPIVFESRRSWGSCKTTLPFASFTREEYEIEPGGRRTSGITIRYLFPEWAVQRYTPREFLARRQCKREAGARPPKELFSLLRKIFDQ